MTRLLGIDLGTSNVKAVIIDERGQLLGVGGQEYPIRIPQPGYAEQAPEDWWQAAVLAVRQALQQAGDALSTTPITAIGLSGQMHGVTLIDAAQQPVGDSIIWADQRGADEIAPIVALVGAETLANVAGTAPAAGFMAPTLRWLLRCDPARLDRAAVCLLPKDYLRLRLTGEIATDASDASATALFDIQQRCWSSAIMQTLGLPERLLPPVLESASISGRLGHSAAETLGLPIGIPVAAGCADQPAQAVGNGLIDPGLGSVTIGTGGQLFAPLTAPRTDALLRLHTFCHAPTDRWYVLGAMLSAGLSLRWFRDLLGTTADPRAYEQLAAQAAVVPPGANGLLFLPYLVGERSPLMDPLARGTFIGLSLQHGRGHLARAIMEGVAFALRQILEVMLSIGTPIDQMLASGGGLANPVWRQIVADVLGRPLRLSTGRERGSVGAALIAGISTQVYASYTEASEAAFTPFELTEPILEQVRFYAEQYARFEQIYPLLKTVLHDLNR